MKTRCEIKMIETQSDVMRENIFYWKSEQYNEEKLGWLFDIVQQWIKWSKQYLEVLTLQNKLNSNFIMLSKMTIS